MIERVASCRCGKVRLRAAGDPILCAVCYCVDCQAAAERLEALGAAPDFHDAWLGTPYATYRDDRMACVEGEAGLEAVKLTGTSPTTRYVASCCGSPMYLKFGPGWWTSIYRARFGDDAPRLELRN